MLDGRQDLSEDRKIDPATPEPGGFSLLRLWPLAVLAAGLIAFFASGAGDYLTFDALKEHRAELLAFVADHAVASALLFVVIYVAIAAFSLPVATVASIAGGFLFGNILGTAWIVIGATIGATILFLAAKTSIGDALRARAGPGIRRMEEGFRKNAFSYLLILRLVPLFPFFVVNLAPAFLGVPLSTYVVATAIGIIPGAFVYAQVGTGLGSVFDAGQDFSPANIVTPDILIALIGLALLSTLPLVYKWWKARKAA